MAVNILLSKSWLEFLSLFELKLLRSPSDKVNEIGQGVIQEEFVDFKLNDITELLLVFREDFIECGLDVSVEALPVDGLPVDEGVGGGDLGRVEDDIDGQIGDGHLASDEDDLDVGGSDHSETSDAGVELSFSLDFVDVGLGHVQNPVGKVVPIDAGEAEVQLDGDLEGDEIDLDVIDHGGQARDDCSIRNAEGSGNGGRVQLENGGIHVQGIVKVEGSWGEDSIHDPGFQVLEAGFGLDCSDGDASQGDGD